MFDGCQNLESVDFKNFFKNSKPILSSFTKMFNGCSSLKKIDFSNANLSSITNAQDAFKGVGNLEFINLKGATMSDSLLQEIINNFAEKHCIFSWSVGNNFQNDEYKCCDSNSQENCLACDNNNINFYDKISSLNNKEEFWKDLATEIRKYYKTEKEGEICYKKCADDIPNCEECSAIDYCTKCQVGFGIIDNNKECQNIEGDKYYYDKDLASYKLCSYKKEKCVSCSFVDTFICNKCQDNYVIKHNNTLQCELKSSLEQDNHFYTNDSGSNYYSCLLYNEINNCLECSNSITCGKCKDNYIFKHNNTLQCELKTSLEKDKQFYTKNNGNNYYSCLLYNEIKNCDECSNSFTCNKCQDNYVFKHNNTLQCELKTSLKKDKQYYTKDNGINYYSCLLYNKIEHCDECSNGTSCVKCQYNYVFKHNNSLECELKSLLEQDKKFYTNDGGNNYYSCLIYNEIEHCDECSNSTSCNKCIDNYAFKHNNTLQCELKSLLEQNKEFYTNDNGNNYYSCLLFNDIENCDECSNSISCNKCQDNYVFKHKNIIHVYYIMK